MEERQIAKEIESVFSHASFWGNYKEEEATRDILQIFKTAYDEMINKLTEAEKQLVHQSTEIAQLQAKVYAYEAIISNSNFKMAIIRNKKESKNDK